MQQQDLCSEPWKSATSPGLRCHPVIPSLVLDLDGTPCKFPSQHRVLWQTRHQATRSPCCLASAGFVPQWPYPVPAGCTAVLSAVLCRQLAGTAGQPLQRLFPKKLIDPTLKLRKSQMKSFVLVRAM